MRKFLSFLLILCTLALIGELGFVVYMETRPAQSIQKPPATEPSTEAAATTQIPETQAPDTQPREPMVFNLTFTGDFTPACSPTQINNPHNFANTIGEDYEFPFANIRPIFEADDFTFINLEVVLGGKGKRADKTFVFQAPEEYVQIMTSSSVECVTLANNHTEDYGAEGYAETKRILDDNGISYVEEDKTFLYTTENGLIIGLYADSFDFDHSDIQASIDSLREQGAEIVICAFHWGTEGSYRANAKQKEFAHSAIDAGADIVVGNHPHVLQVMEEYGDGLIFYSLGNFSFGGNTQPRDRDSAIISQQIVRDSDGTVHIGKTTIIPIAISTDETWNNYQPIPLEEGSEAYNRVLAKLSGTFDGNNLQPGYDYSKE